MHFPTREALIEAVTERAISEVVEMISAADPATGTAAEALGRTIAAAWRGLGRFHALVTINVSLPPKELRRRHAPVMALIAPLIERGQHDGTLRKGVPVSWQLATILALVHAASTEFQAGRLTSAEVESTLVATVLGALSPAGGGAR
jgi:AcrR family transcriptional regulator